MQVDITGLNTGDLFPVGTTILQWVAYDIFGNASDTCEIKVIVNDFHTPPTVVCPEDITVISDPGTCGAMILDDISVEFEDNCTNNVFISYEAIDELNMTYIEGVEDATGQIFINGTTTLKYVCLLYTSPSPRDA